MMMMMGHNGCPMTTMGETVTFHDDMEQLCIRMAEHALEINGMNRFFFFGYVLVSTNPLFVVFVTDESIYS